MVDRAEDRQIRPFQIRRFLVPALRIRRLQIRPADLHRGDDLLGIGQRLAAADHAACRARRGQHHRPWGERDEEGAPEAHGLVPGMTKGYGFRT